MPIANNSASVCELQVVRNERPRPVEVASYFEARSALLAVLKWADMEAQERPFNLTAVQEAILGILSWLQPDEPLDKTVIRATENFRRLAGTYCDFDWLFDDAGELRVSGMSSDLFESLVDSRLVADRLNQAIGD